MTKARDESPSRSTSARIEATFAELAKCIAAQHPTFVPSDGYAPQEGERLGLRDGLTTESQQLRWEVVDLAEYRENDEGFSIDEVEEHYAPLFPHAGVLAALALNPKFAQAMDGWQVPFVYCSGYAITRPEEYSRTFCPMIWKNEASGVCFGQDTTRHRSTKYMVPIIAKT